VHYVRVGGIAVTTGFTAGAGNLNLSIARGYTANGTGGTAATLTGNNNKLRTSMGSSLVGDLRTASAAALGAGTKTYDSQAVGLFTFGVPATANINLLPSVLDLYNEVNQGDQPIVLAQNEGLGLRATVPATGVWQFSVEIEWSEVNTY
jgi:hypothetical protein